MPAACLRRGEPRDLGFPAVPHWDLGGELGLLDVEAPARMSGSGFSLLKGDLARLERALINWFLDRHRQAGWQHPVQQCHQYGRRRRHGQRGGECNADRSLY